jgi:hypothetical protein
VGNADYREEVFQKSRGIQRLEKIGGDVVMDGDKDLGEMVEHAFASADRAKEKAALLAIVERVVKLERTIGFMSANLPSRLVG